MIPETAAQVEPPVEVIVQSPEQVWRLELAQALRTPQALLEALDFSRDDITKWIADDQGFMTLVPFSYVRRMQANNIHDPLLLQVLPQAAEALNSPSFLVDPLAEAQFNPQPGVIQKYQGRALIIAAGHCAINCRYCFRRHYPYGQQQRSRDQWHDSLQYIASDPSITEVILSGGDPLALTNALLFNLLDEIEALPHLKRLRIHSRLPIVLPQRITDALCQRLANSPLQVVMVLHANHPQELDRSVHEACQKLRSAQVTLLNQSVLLANINDSADCLTELSEGLFDMGVLPYYLHLPDRVKGTQHFFIDTAQGQTIVAQLQKQLPGYLVPRLVREDAGAANKTLIPMRPVD